MAIYTDNVHLIADTPEEPHAFARKLGLKREWFQDHPDHPHYDLTGDRMRAKALTHGAKVLCGKEIICIYKRTWVKSPTKKTTRKS